MGLHEISSSTIEQLREKRRRSVARIKTKQESNHPDVHHPEEKIQQLDRFKHLLHGPILEVFAGKGNLTPYYRQFGDVEPLSMERNGDSFDYVHFLRSKKRRFGTVDIDGYGSPEKLLPTVMEMLRPQATLIFTIPYATRPWGDEAEVRCRSFWGSDKPDLFAVEATIFRLAFQRSMASQFVEMTRLTKGTFRYVFVVEKRNFAIMFGRDTRRRTTAESAPVLA